jgi:hypothetical protein
MSFWCMRGLIHQFQTLNIQRTDSQKNLKLWSQKRRYLHRNISYKRKTGFHGSSHMSFSSKFRRMLKIHYKI